MEPSVSVRAVDPIHGLLIATGRGTWIYDSINPDDKSGHYEFADEYGAFKWEVPGPRALDMGVTEADLLDCVDQAADKYLDPDTIGLAFGFPRNSGARRIGGNFRSRLNPHIMCQFTPTSVDGADWDAYFAWYYQEVEKPNPVFGQAIAMPAQPPQSDAPAIALPSVAEAREILPSFRSQRETDRFLSTLYNVRNRYGDVDYLAESTEALKREWAAVLKQKRSELPEQWWESIQRKIPNLAESKDWLAEDNSRDLLAVALAESLEDQGFLAAECDTQTVAGGNREISLHRMGNVAEAVVLRTPAKSVVTLINKAKLSEDKIGRLASFFRRTVGPVSITESADAANKIMWDELPVIEAASENAEFWEGQQPYFKSGTHVSPTFSADLHNFERQKLITVKSSAAVSWFHGRKDYPEGVTVVMPDKKEYAVRNSADRGNAVILELQPIN